MPYHRIIRLQTPLVAWHDLTLLEDQPPWSSTYRVETPRVLLPRGGRIVCEMAGRRFGCDALSPLWLVPETPYRVQRLCRGQRSVVVLFNELPPRPAQRLGSAALLMLARLGAAFERGAADALRVEEQLLLALQAPPAAAAAGETASRRAVERAREWLAAHPAHPATLADIASASHSSPFHLARQFRRCTGLSLHAYRTRLRMALALEQLRGGESDLSALALALGYASHSHFSAVFKSTFGSTPREVRRNLTAPQLPAGHTAP